MCLVLKKRAKLNTTFTDRIHNDVTKQISRRNKSITKISNTIRVLFYKNNHDKTDFKYKFLISSRTSFAHNHVQPFRTSVPLIFAQELLMYLETIYEQIYFDLICTYFQRNCMSVYA